MSNLAFSCSEATPHRSTSGNHILTVRQLHPRSRSEKMAPFLDCIVTKNSVLNALRLASSFVSLMNVVWCFLFCRDPLKAMCLKLYRACFRLIEYCLNVENMDLSAIRTIRVLRPLRAINRIPSELWHHSPGGSFFGLQALREGVQQQSEKQCLLQKTMHVIGGSVSSYSMPC